MLIIELDGEIHRFQKSKDNKREADLRKSGYIIVRFKNREILDNLYNVQKTLEYLIDNLENDLN